MHKPPEPSLTSTSSSTTVPLPLTRNLFTALQRGLAEAGGTSSRPFSNVLCGLLRIPLLSMFGEELQ